MECQVSLKSVQENQGKSTLAISTPNAIMGYAARFISSYHTGTGLSNQTGSRQLNGRLFWKVSAATFSIQIGEKYGHACSRHTQWMGLWSRPAQSSNH
uniref:Uncharacterized protein n=1 Tax=Pyxicephalus adspersus TaxID=30357 RepID=A0AAV3ALI8_PYXAD|nr:TPA: hypothetical protein GDO54_010360 [Pyxicephalus adspersus]